MAGHWSPPHTDPDFHPARVLRKWGRDNLAKRKRMFNFRDTLTVLHVPGMRSSSSLWFFIFLPVFFYIMLSATPQFGLIQGESSMFNFIGCIVIAYVLWRLWRFSVRPFFIPHSPRDIPYMIPCESCMD